MSDEAELGLIPVPAAVRLTGGELVLPQDVVIAPGGEARPEQVGRYLVGRLEELRGARPRLAPGAHLSEPCVRLDVEQRLSARGTREAYRLSATRDGVRISGASAEGVFRGVTTLLQLLSTHAGASAVLPCVEIEDQPRFPWRGLMLDCGRYFYPKQFLFKFLDMMAMHKLNVFHWHLTEDQGWRLEIRAYPRLTDVGAWRRQTTFGHAFVGCGGDGTPHGGFYSQADVREVVAYAAERFITVVPEIEMPGHAQAALASYPELACVEAPIEVSCRWGVHKNVFNVGRDGTFTFLETVLGETAALFPSPYIHIGGDECPKDQWRANRLCQERIRREGLADEDELQSWTIRRIGRFVASLGRRLVGWDEILEGGLAPDATVMSWRGEAGGIAAARAGHDVVMTPKSSVYLDYYQGDPAREPLAIGGMLPLEKVYAYEPVPAELDETAAGHVLGAQGNVWSEYMPTTRNVEYMTLPRAAALAETVWSPKASRNQEDFMRRLTRMCARYEAVGWMYRSLKMVKDEPA